MSHYDIAVTKCPCKCSGGRDVRPLLVVIDGNDSFWDGLLTLDGKTTGCFGVQFIPTYAGFNLSTVTVSNRPLISKVNNCLCRNNAERIIVKPLQWSPVPINSHVDISS